MFFFLSVFSLYIYESITKNEHFMRFAFISTYGTESDTYTSSTTFSPADTSCFLIVYPGLRVGVTKINDKFYSAECQTF